MFGIGLITGLFREVEKAARQELTDEQQQIMTRLRALHQQLERGQINDDQFDDLETPLLNRLEQIKRVLDN